MRDYYNTTTKSTLLDTRHFYIFDAFVKKTSSIDNFKGKASSISQKMEFSWSFSDNFTLTFT